MTLQDRAGRSRTGPEQVDRTGTWLTQAVAAMFQTQENPPPLFGETAGSTRPRPGRGEEWLLYGDRDQGKIGKGE